jgi:ribonuclease-3
MEDAMSNDEALKKLLNQLNVPLPPEVLELALTHRSYAYEFGGLPTNERLEFLGDSVIGLIITETLYRNFPQYDESKLSPLRSGVVSTRALAEIARKLELGKSLRIGRGEELTDGRNKSSILADALEALIGAIYIEHGLALTEKVITHLMSDALQEALVRGASLDGKTALQEIVATLGYGAPEYEVSNSGPDHAKEFSAFALVNGERISSGRGKSKREAEQEAARIAYELLLEESQNQ